MAFISEIKLSESVDWGRMDAEFFQPHYRQLASKYSTHPRLGDLAPLILHPAEIKRVYADEGVPYLLAQYIKPLLLDCPEPACIPRESAMRITQNRLQVGDVLVTRTGANYGDCAVYVGDPSEFYASAHVLVVRPNGVKGEYLATWLNTTEGRALVKRGAYGSSQPELAPDYLRAIPVPRLGRLEEEVCLLVKEAYSKWKESYQLYTVAESQLLDLFRWDELGMEDVLAYETTMSAIQEAERVDAEYYQPKYERAMQKLESIPRARLAPLSELAVLVTNGHTPCGHDLSQGDISFLTAEHVYDYLLDYGTDKRIEQAHHHGELQRTALNNGDLLITIKGKTGNAALVFDLPSPTNINQDVALLRLRDGVDPWYVTSFLNSPFGKMQSARLSTNQINPFLGLGNLRKILVPVFPVDEMKRWGGEVRGIVLECYAAREQTKTLLEKAKRQVEEALP